MKLYFSLQCHIHNVHVNLMSISFHSYFCKEIPYYEYHEDFRADF